MQNRQAATAYMGGRYRITVVVAVATSCASGMSRFGGREFLVQEKSSPQMLTPLHFYFSHYFKYFKEEYSNNSCYFCCSSF